MKIYEITNKSNNIPPEHETIKIPNNYVRLFHQTSEENLKNIKQHGIQFNKAKGIEGPKGIWATEPNDGAGFYGNVTEVPTVEFAIPKKEWEATFPAIQRDIKPNEIIAIHYPWHSTVRYFIKHNMLDKVKNGEYDYLLDNDDDYSKAIHYIKST